MAVWQRGHQETAIGVLPQTSLTSSWRPITPIGYARASPSQTTPDHGVPVFELDFGRAGQLRPVQHGKRVARDHASLVTIVVRLHAIERPAPVHATDGGQHFRPGHLSVAVGIQALEQLLEQLVARIRRARLREPKKLLSRVRLADRVLRVARGRKKRHAEQHSDLSNPHAVDCTSGRRGVNENDRALASRVT